MTRDADGNLKPYMLSTLIKDAKKTLDEYGDMPIWSVTEYEEHGHNLEISQPISFPPRVGVPQRFEYYWGHQDSRYKYDKAFVISGSSCG